MLDNHFYDYRHNSKTKDEGILDVDLMRRNAWGILQRAIQKESWGAFQEGNWGAIQLGEWGAIQEQPWGAI